MTARLFPALLMCCLLCCCGGCRLVDAGRKITDSTLSSFRMLIPRPPVDPDDAEDEEDDWAWVGQDARGNRPTEKEDPLFWMMSSEKSRQIHRSLGISN